MVCKQTKATTAMDFPGVAIDKSDDERVTAREEQQRTAALDNNPRTNGDIV